MTAEALLTVEGVSKHFGSLAAVTGVSFALQGGCITALIGPNGAGKTTLLNLITGYLAQDGGTIRLRGQALDRWPASRRVACGLGRTFQLVQLFGHLTALENVLCGLHLSVRQRPLSALLGTARFRSEERSLQQQAGELLAAVGLGAHSDQPARELAYGLQRRLEVARALATRPAVLLLDEPVAGLSGPEAEELGQLLQQLSRDGMSLLVVEHNMPFVMGIAQRVLVLDAGQVIADAPPERVQSDPRVIEAYLGEMQHEPA